MALSKINRTSLDTGIDDNSDATAITIDSSENVGIGTATPADKLDVTGDIRSSNDLKHNRRVIPTSSSGDGSASLPSICPGYDYDTGLYKPASNQIAFTCGGTERGRWHSNGTFLVNKTAQSTTTAGVQLEASGVVAVTRSGGTAMIVNRLTNNGNLVSFRQANTEEGTISVSGTTVSYNSFTGSHWSRLSDNSKPTILRGTVMETLDTMLDWYNLEFDVTDEEGNTYSEQVPHVLTDGQSVGDVITYNYEGTDYQATIVKENDIKHMQSKVSDTVDAKNVYGVFNDWDNDGDGYNDFWVSAVGTYVVRIKANETIAKGDLLQSNGDGTAKVQTDDAVRSSSFAKILSTTIIETYDDGSFIVPCSLSC